eukprot:jgi/Mesvir1/12036/Mv00326-RA.1
MASISLQRTQALLQARPTAVAPLPCNAYRAAPLKGSASQNRNQLLSLLPKLKRPDGLGSTSLPSAASRRRATLVTSLLDFSNSELKHVLKINVKAPLKVCYNIWEDRAGYPRFLSLLSEVNIQPYDTSLSQAVVKYQFGWESVDGLPNTGLVELQELPNGTVDVSFTVTYKLPGILATMAGAGPVKDNIEQILSSNLKNFKALAESMA